MTTEQEADSKVCPMCAESIKAAALVCKHCGYDHRTSTTTLAAPPKYNVFALGYIGLATLLFVIVLVIWSGSLDLS